MVEHNIHLVGSVPLDDSETVFRTVSDAVGPALLRLPDGEVGERLTWLPWLDPVFSENPMMEATNVVFQHHAAASKMRPLPY